MLVVPAFLFPAEIEVTVIANEDGEGVEVIGVGTTLEEADAAQNAALQEYERNPAPVVHVTSDGAANGTVREIG